MGGLYRVVESFVEIAEANGVQFRYNTPVREIEIVDNRAQGVILDDGERLHADLVVANADLPYVYRALLPDPGPVKRLERMKYTCSAIMFYWGLDKIYPQLDHHNVFLAGDYKASFDRIFKDKTLLDSLNFYVHAPARTDPAAAPEGEETLMVLIPVGHLDASVPQDWEALKARARASVLQCLEPMGVTDLDDHMKFEVCYAPKQWKVLYNLERGAAFGLSHNFTQVGYLRPQNRHRRYHNLFFVGSSTHPGTGLPIVLLSARLTTERIMKEQPLSS